MLRILAFCVAAVLFSACGKKAPRFELLRADETGIHFNNEIIEKDTFNILHNEYMYNGGGVGVADLNKDGLPDLVFTGNRTITRIYLNLGGFKFKDITEKFEGLTADQWVSGVTVTDVNADGWTDLFFTCTMSKDSLLRKDQLWVNQGLGGDGLPSFKNLAAQHGIADTGHSMHSAFFDYDLDGDLDLYILNNIVTHQVPSNYHPKVTDGTAINNDAFYENEGDGHFKNVTKAAGIVYEGFGLGIAVGDINKDGYPDIYISNDYISNDLLYINQQDGTFRNEIGQFMSYQSKFSMGNDMSDVNNDGNLDVITVDMMPEQYFRKKQTINGNGYNIYHHDAKYGYEHQYVRNMLHLHNGFQDGKMLPFSEVGQMTGVYQTEWSWSPLFADFDNDGDRDLVVTNGFPKDLTDKDFTNYKAAMYGYLAGDADILPRIPIVKVSNYAFENQGDSKFVNQTDAWGMSLPSFSNGAAFVDLDNDGDLDYVTNNINDPAFVYRNNTIGKLEEKPNYLRISLEGIGKNTMAIGAKVELWSGGQLQYQEHFLSRGYISSVDPVLHFGLGNNTSVDSLRVTWSGGQRVTFLKNVPSNQTLVLKETEAAPKAQNAPVAQQNQMFQPLENAIEYTHEQQDYIDFFQAQRILQHKFSQVGPCIAKGDLDGDGVEDLLIGGSANAPATAFRNKGNGQFEKTDLPGLTGTKSCLEADLAIFDADQDGDNDVVSAAGGYANENEADYRHCFFENKCGKFERVELPTPAFPASCVRPFDFDKDGDLDLFIGARVKRGNFPQAPASHLLVNNQGKFSTDEALTLDLGMVTDAVWSDFDGDGWTDLLATREWNSVALLKNHNGKTFKPFEQKDLDTKRGFWSCAAAGDLDGDGDEDYVLGNLGENHRFLVSDEYPMGLYEVDVDKNGTIDPIAAAFWKDEKGKMQEYPVNYLDELAAQSPFFRKKFTSYTQFSHTRMDSIVSKPMLETGKKWTVNLTSSCILWNEGGGKFTWERLPTAAQIAPVKKILVQNFDGDQQPDLLLAGNDYSFDVSTGRYDASKGILFLNRGGRKFEAQTPNKSGLAMSGQVESLVYLDGHLFAGVNRGKLLIFKQMNE